MSSCLILQDKNNFYIGADTACSVNINGEYYRYSDNIEKIFVHGNDTYFCSGSVSAVNNINFLIHKIFHNKSNIDIELLSQILKVYYPVSNNDIFDVEIMICRKEQNIPKVYQLSQYKNYNPIVYMPRGNGVNILCCGYKTQDVYNISRRILLQGCSDIQNLYQNVFDSICDNKVGGNVILYKNGKLILHTKIKEQDIEYSNNIGDFHLLIAEMVLSGYIEGSRIVGGTIQIGLQPDGSYAFEVHADGTVTMGGGSSIGGYTASDLDNMQNNIQNVQNEVQTINSQKMYRIEITCAGPQILKIKNQTATLTCHVYSWDTEITDTLDDSCFNWKRYSDNTDQDEIWNNNTIHQGRKSLTISTEDITNNANFVCEVTLPDDE